ncbi:MAG: extracellular solute-binding protein [Acidimicrobiia bacterium]
MRPRRMAVPIALLIAITAACSAGGGESLRIYTSVTQGTVDSVVEGFAADHPDVAVEVFRAPSGELAARIAAEQRQGGIGADVLWLTDPLSMQQYEAQGLLHSWNPDGSSIIADEYRTSTFWGTRLLTMVMVVGDGIDPPATWADLTEERFEGRVAFPDPGFAGSSLAVLGYFAATDGYGLEFYEALAANGATQVNAPGEVVTGVAEDRFDVGITLAFSARNAIDNGSPLAIAWPTDGAIALYSPMAIVESGGDLTDAEAFLEYTLSFDAQQRIADSGWQPILADIEWEIDGLQVTVDWEILFDRQQDLLAAYRSIFGG